MKTNVNKLWKIWTLPRLENQSPGPPSKNWVYSPTSITDVLHYSASWHVIKRQSKKEVWGQRSWPEGSKNREAETVGWPPVTSWNILNVHIHLCCALGLPGLEGLCVWRSDWGCDRGRKLLGILQSSQRYVASIRCHSHLLLLAMEITYQFQANRSGPNTVKSSASALLQRTPYGESNLAVEKPKNDTVWIETLFVCKDAVLKEFMKQLLICSPNNEQPDPNLGMWDIHRSWLGAKVLKAGLEPSQATVQSCWNPSSKAEA